MDGYNGQNGYDGQNDYESYNGASSYDSLNQSLFPEGAQNGYQGQGTSPDIPEYSVLEDYDQLSPEEIEYEKRRKAAARRRKLAAREARRKKRRRQAIIRCSIFLAAVVLVFAGVIKMITGIVTALHKDKSPKKTTEQTKEPSTEQMTTEAPAPEIDETILAKDLPADRDAAIASLTALAATDPDLQNILDNAAVYPDDILRNLAADYAMKQFVINYPAKISVVFDGDFSVDFSSDTVPLFIQYDEQWGYADYGKDIIALRGAGPTCLSMAYTFLKQDGSMNPIKVADYATEQGFLDENSETAWTLMTTGAIGLGLGTEEMTISESNIISALENDKLVICAMSPGDFTRSSHFILIREYKDNLFYINDPASEARSQVGWSYSRLESQIANMWAISAQGSGDSGTTQSNDNQENGTSPDTSQDGSTNPADSQDGGTGTGDTQGNDTDTTNN
ncbi:MAG: C39 family peptidase [Clostridium sp.]|nr:C39 family peptidase [Clostridium sp.]